ncbi:receptor-type tyrosine-protein phosphatase H-like [Watersipora subatra]|uniref:receptor-type tyrosine-protein phosphatase H-like n=1 Tax=Watersipora subatra TaxID=2589382 RepID=UPI00355C38E0
MPDTTGWLSPSLPSAPSPPSAPQLLSRTTDSLNVSWTGNASFYVLQHGVGDTLNDSLTNRIKVTTAMITNLIAGETYSIKVIAYNDVTGGIGVPGQATNITTIPNPTGVPTAVRASTDSSTIATVSWSNPTNTEWDDVTVSCQPSCTNQKVDNSTSTVDITGLTPGETYTFTTVVSSNGVKSSPSQTSAPLTMIPNPTGVPTAVRASTDNSTIATVSWSNPTNTEWDDVTVSCQPSCTNQTVHNSMSTVDITGLTPGETYTFTTVVSSNGVKSSPSQTSAPLTMKPSDPTSFRASANGQNITLSWSYPTGHVTSGFSLRCSPSIDGCNSIWKPVGSENSTTITLFGATLGQTYSFTLRAESGPAVSKVYSDGASVAINMDAASPSNLHNIDENRDNLTLRWNAPLNVVLHSYRLYWNATNGAQSNYADTKDSTTTTLTVSTLEPGFSYDFSVASLSDSGALSSPSNVISYTAYPSEVTGLTLKPPSHDTLIFTWNFTGRYENFTYSLFPDTPGSQVFLTNQSDVYTLKYSSLSVDTEYNFTVGTQVQDAANASSYKFSEFITASGRTDEFNPDQVVGLRIVKSTNDSITISWNPPDQPNGVIIGYVVQRYIKDESGCAQSVFFNCTNCQRREYDYSTTVINLTSQCSQQDPDWSYDSTDIFSYEFTGLKVFTEYIFKIFAINTKVPSVDNISLTTNEAAPGPVRNLTVDTEARILYAKWLPPSKDNGVIREYGVEVFESDNEVEGANLVFSSNTNDTQLNITKDIKPYTSYTISVRAKTGFVKWGPEVISLPVITLQSAPTVGPANFQNTSWESQNITLTWSEIPPEHRNGEIRGYILRFNLSNGESIIKNLSKDSRTVTVSVEKANSAYVFKLAGYVMIDGQRVEGSPASISVMSKPADERREEGLPAVIRVRTSAAGLSGWTVGVIVLIVIVIILTCLLTILLVRHVKMIRKEEKKEEGVAIPQINTDYDVIADTVELKKGMSVNGFSSFENNNLDNADAAYEMPKASPEAHQYDVIGKR